MISGIQAACERVVVSGESEQLEEERTLFDVSTVRALLRWRWKGRHIYTFVEYDGGIEGKGGCGETW